ncbi:MAG: hypothetical protein ABWX67_00280, partial [Allosphingosinicella sp.]
AMTVALGAFIANLLVLASGIAVIAHYSKQNPFALGLHVFRPFAAAAAMAASVRLLGPDSGSSIVDLTGGVAIGILAYPLFLVGLWWASGRPPGGEREALNLLVEIRQRLRRRPAAGEA